MSDDPPQTRDPARSARSAPESASRRRGEPRRTPRDGPTPSRDEPPALGLAPADALRWLRLQRALAWQPEQVAPALRAGHEPEALLERLSRSPAPAGRPPARRSPFEGGGALAPPETLERDVRQLEALGARVVPLGDPAYPAALASLDDAPLVLLVRGRVEALARPALAIVGARAATRPARAFARRLARELAGAGFAIVSGLARGIDGEAHRGALEATGATIGVLACGPERIYPPEHRALAASIEADGAIVSELPLGSPPRRLHFPLRNRIISGLTRAVVVVEARRRSGSLITVRHALDHGREVFVVPGSVDGPFAEGTNQLLRDGARPIRSARDLLEDLGSGPGASQAGSETRAAVTPAPGTPLASQVLELLEEGPASRDELVLAVGLDAAGLAETLLELELCGRIVEERDGRIHLSWS